MLAGLCDKGYRTFACFLLGWLDQCYGSSVKGTTDNCIKKRFYFFHSPVLIGQTPRKHTGRFPMSTCKFFGFLKCLKGLRYPLIQSHLIVECIYFESSWYSLLQHREWISKVFSNTENGFPTSFTCIAPPWEMPLHSRIDISALPRRSVLEPWVGGCSISVLEQ